MAETGTAGSVGNSSPLGAVLKVVNSSYFFWTVLAVPSIPLILQLVEGSQGSRGRSPAHEIVELSGVVATLLLLAALALSPLQTIFPRSGVLAWFVKRRRYLGVAAFSYSVVHVVFYFIDLGSLREVLAEFSTPLILTGWVALFVFVPLAITSNAVMVRAMGWRRWKTVQRGAYVAAVLVLAHWLIVEPEPGPMIFFGVVAALEAYRLWRYLANRNANASPVRS